MKEYDSYLFDADGTLFDTVDLICRCFDYITLKYGGIRITRESIISGIGSPLRDQIVRHLGADLDHDRVLEDYQVYQLGILEDGVSSFPHVVETLDALKVAGKKLAVVTSRRRFSLEKILESTDTMQYFDVLVTPEDTIRHKPSGDPALKAMDLLDASPGATVFAGDAHYDICSGAEAGIDTVFVKWSHVDITSLPVPPTWSIDNIQELTASLR